ncbi:hypothetical protein ACERK3_04675 [Phycisphaerales bacterium AB-hyl4]|uniref:Quinol:cytochrome c oxidoreductase quinone-binding subunit 2 n=1 Tax=Natronomicrosphaera hydrolytica TaxID=3242702 RepID=A0ABV4U1V3_9BACT
MAHNGPIQLSESETRPLGDRAWPVYSLGFLLGLGGLLLAVLVAFFLPDGGRRFAFAYLVSYSFVLAITLGCLFFVLITHLFRAGWSVLVRRPAEAIAANMPVVAVLSAPILLFALLGDGQLYPWAHWDMESAQAAHAEAAAEAEAVAMEISAAQQGVELPASTRRMELNPYDQAAVDGEVVPGMHYVMGKRAWLNIPFFGLRWIFYMVVLSGIAIWYWRTSVKQDVTADAALTRKMEIFAAPAIVIYGVVITFLSFDLIMSLDPLWYSTVFGVYYFSGGMLAALSVMILTLIGLQKWGWLTHVTTEHFHDLGKLLFAFVFFWGYIAFSQYMLLWYASLPDTAYWFEMRGASTVVGRGNAWTVIVLALLFGHLLIPFAGLLSRHAKRNRAVLAFWCVWLLVFCWLDLYWVIMPMFEHRTIPVPVVELLCLVGIVGITLAGAVRTAAGHSLVPSGDPRLGESVAFHNI